MEFFHARRFFGKSTGEEFYILNKDENNNKLNEDKYNKNEELKNDISKDKNLVNTINVTSLNKEKDLNTYFDKLLNQEMDKDRIKLFEMELKENGKNNNLFPINIQKNIENKNVNDIIKDIKQKEIEKENEKKKLEKQKEEEEKMDY